MDARREAQRISGIFASFATKQTRFLAATRRDGASWAHFGVVRPRHIPDMAAGSRLELRPTRCRRISENKSDRLPGEPVGIRMTANSTCYRRKPTHPVVGGTVIPGITSKSRATRRL